VGSGDPRSSGPENRPINRAMRITLHRVVAAIVALIVLAAPARGQDWRSGNFLTELWTTPAITRLDDMDWSAPPYLTYAFHYFRIPNVTDGIWPNATSIPNNYVMRFTGRIQVLAGQTGLYRFRIGSHYGSRLIINGVTVIDHDGYHPNVWKEGTITLAEGMHDIEVQHFNAWQWHWLDLQWSLPPGGTPPTPEYDAQGNPLPIDNWPPPPVWRYPPVGQRWYDLSKVPLYNQGGRIFYLKTSGNDANDGLHPTRAFRTIDHAVAQLRGADTLIIGKGTYDGTITLHDAGDFYNRVYIYGDIWGGADRDKAADASEVVIRNNGTVVNITGDSRVFLERLTFDGQNGPGPVVNVEDNSLWIQNDAYIRNAGPDGLVKVSNGGYLRLHGTKLHTSQGDAIIVDQSSMHADYLNRVWDINGAAIRSLPGSRDARIWFDRSQVWDVEHFLVHGGGQFWASGNLIRDIRDDAIQMLNNNAWTHIFHNTFAQIGGDGINQTHAWGSHFRNNIMADVGGPVFRYTAGHVNNVGNIYWDWTGTNAYVGWAGDPSNRFIDPMFRNPAADDFRLADGSPAIDGKTSNDDSRDRDWEWKVDVGMMPDVGGWEGPAPSPQVAAALPYSTDFDAGADTHWDFRQTEDLPGYGRVMGRYSQDFWPRPGGPVSVSLLVQTTPGVEHVIMWDLFVLDTWDNEDFIVRANASTAWRRRFHGSADPTLQTYDADPDFVGAISTVTTAPDRLYRRCVARFIPATTETRITFTSTLNQWQWDEAWAIDNVRVMERSDIEEQFPYYYPASIRTSFNRPSTTHGSRGSSVLWADMNNDGLQDAFVTGVDHSALRLQTAPGVFSHAALSSKHTSSQAGIFDADTDRDADIHSGTGGSAATILVNNGSGGLTAWTTTGMPTTSANVYSAAADFDLDGRADLLTITKVDNRVFPATAAPGSIGFTLSDDPAVWGDLTGMAAEGDGGGFASADLNNDRRPDYAYDLSGGLILLSDADGTYTASSSGVSIPSQTQRSNGSFGDYDNDGDFDLLWPNGHTTTASVPRLFRNNADGTFTDVSVSSGMNQTQQFAADGTPSAATGRFVSGRWGDFDNDGDLDALFARRGANVIMRNNGDGTFEAANVNAGHTGNGIDAILADPDNDGDLDIVVTNASGENMAYLSNRADNQNYLKVRVLGRGLRGTNTLGIGTRVELRSADGSSLLQVREVGQAAGHGQEPLWLHFGGVNPSGTYTLRVYFRRRTVDVAVIPSSASTTIGATTIPQMVTLDERTLAPIADVASWQEVPAVE
jgi:hypothetical protein